MDFGNKMHEIQEMEGPEKQNGKSLSSEAMENLTDCLKMMKCHKSILEWLMNLK